MRSVSRLHREDAHQPLLRAGPTDGAGCLVPTPASIMEQARETHAAHPDEEVLQPTARTSISGLINLLGTQLRPCCCQPRAVGRGPPQ